MKFNQKIIYAMLALGIMTGTTACKKGFEDINKPYNQGSTATQSIPGLFNGMSKVITDEDYTLNVCLFYPITNQQGTQNVSAPFFNYTSSLWTKYYPMLHNYKSLLRLIEKESVPGSYNNVKYMASIMMASRTLHMLDYYGQIPYSEAGLAETGSGFYSPAYDKEADVYASVLSDLKIAADGLTLNSPGQVNIGASESFLANNFNSWVKFANALRLRYAVRLYNKDQALATGIITDIIGGNKPLPNNQVEGSLQNDNFGSWPSVVPPNSPDYFDRQWYAFRENSVSNIRLSTNVFAQMTSNTADQTGTAIYDPRCFVFFQTNNDDKWIAQAQNGSQSDGGVPYKNDLVARQPIGADPANKFSAFNFFLAYDYKNFPCLIITEADVHFLKAEIYQRGMGVAANIVLAKSEYEAGITSSVNFWYAYTQLSATWTVKPTKPTALKMTAFLTNPAVLYNGANNADALKKIATQGWLATLFQPAEAWAIVRRTGLTPKDPTYNPTVVNKLPYPNDEASYNNANWKAVTGGANPTAQTQVKVYWMP
jgi:hypothetical protein